MSAQEKPPPPTRREIAARRRERQLAELDRVRALSQVHADPDPTETTLRKLAEAEQLRAASRALRAAQAPRAEVLEMFARARAVEMEIAEAHQRLIDRRWMNNTTRESSRLAAQRGEVVELETVYVETPILDEHGARTRYRSGPRKGSVRTRLDRVTRPVNRANTCSLVEAVDKGHLLGGGRKLKALIRIGLRYREAYEIVEGLSTSRGEGGGSKTGGGPQVRAVEAGEELAIFRRDLAPRWRDCLDLVCGRGVHLRRAAADMGVHFNTARRALQEGLESARWSWTAHILDLEAEKSVQEEWA